MKTKNKIMITLLIISSITAGLIPVYAATNQLTASNKIKVTRVKPTLAVKDRLLVNSFSAVRNAEAVDLSSMDESS